MNQKASAVWNGNLLQGTGSISTGSGALVEKPYSFKTGSISTGSGALVEKPYSFKTRFEGEQGTNPEELIAAAHAGCFSMALSMILGMAGVTPEKIETTATVTLEKVGDGFEITKSHLDVVAVIPGATQESFEQAAAAAKAGCPVSKLLKAEITMDAKLG